MSIPRKLKICKTCKDPAYLWSNGNCQRCAGLIRAKEKPFKPLAQTKDGKQAKVFKIKAVSDSMAKRLKLYRKNRDEHFKEKPVCEFPGCESTDITLHHKRGRCGAYLTDKRYMCSLCLPHHIWVNENNDEAMKIGLVESRLAIG